MHGARWWATLVILALVPWVPTAVAQTGVVSPELTVDLEPLDEAIDPTGGATVVVGRVALRTQVPSPVPVRVTLSLEMVPSWAIARLDPEYVDLSTSPLDPNASREFHVIVTLARGAPAFQPESLRVEADSQPTGIYYSDHRGAEISIEVGYLGHLAVEVPVNRFALPPGGVTHLPFRITNLGNADTKVTVSIEGDAGPLAIAIPPPLLFAGPSSTRGQDVQMLVVPFLAEGRLSGPTPVTLRFTPAWALDSGIVGTAVDVVIVVEPGGQSPLAGAFSKFMGEDMSRAGREDPDPWSTSGFGEGDGELSVQSAPRSGFSDLPNLRPVLPFLGAILGGAIGFAYARRRLQP